MRRRKPPVAHAVRHTLMQKAYSLSKCGLRLAEWGGSWNWGPEHFQILFGVFFLMAWKELYCTLLKECTSTETENANGEVIHSSKFKNSFEEFTTYLESHHRTLIINIQISSDICGSEPQYHMSRIKSWTVFCSHYISNCRSEGEVLSCWQLQLVLFVCLLY